MSELTLIDFFRKKPEAQTYGEKTLELLQQETARFLSHHDVPLMFKKKDFLYGLRTLASNIDTQYTMDREEPSYEPSHKLYDQLSIQLKDGYTNCRFSSAIIAQVLLKTRVANARLIILPRPYEYFHAGALVLKNDQLWIAEFARQGAQVNRMESDIVKHLPNFPLTAEGIEAFDKTLE